MSKVLEESGQDGKDSGNNKKNLFPSVAEY